MYDSNVVPKDPKQTSPKPFTPPLACPQRMAKVKLDLEFRKFLKVLQKLYINISFIDALPQMPSYAKFLKEILSNKRKSEEHETMALTEAYSVVIQNKLTAKFEGSDSFSILCLMKMYLYILHCVIWG